MRGRGGEAGRRATRGARGGAAPFGRERGRAGVGGPPEWGGGQASAAPSPRAPSPRASSLGPADLAAPTPRQGAEEAPPPPGTAPSGAPRPLLGTRRAGPGRSRSRRRSFGVRALKGARPLSPGSGARAAVSECWVCLVPVRADLGGGGFACRGDTHEAACKHVAECVCARALTRTRVHLQLLS